MHTILTLLLVSTGIGTASLFIMRELWKRWQPRIVNRLDETIRREFSRFPRQYKEFMLSTLRFVDVRGLGIVGFYTPELDEVFVDLSLVPSPPSQVSAGLLSPAMGDARLS